VLKFDVWYEDKLAGKVIMFAVSLYAMVVNHHNLLLYSVATESDGDFQATLHS